jgi:hypothetical protein
MSIRAINDDDLGVVVVVERIQRARKQYRCNACVEPIVKGEYYRYVWSVVEGDGHTQRLHQGCV